MTFKNQLEGKVWGEPDQVREDEQGHPGQSKGAEAAQQKELSRIASVCHHMRTPINGIIGLTDLIRESKLKPDQQYQLDAIQSACKGLMNMVNELTEFSRLKAGLESFELVSFNIHNLVEDVKYLCETLIVDDRLKLAVSMDTAIPKMLAGDPSKLSQVLLHLLGDSLKNIHQGHLLLDVQFIHQEDERVFLEFQISTLPASIPDSPNKNKSNIPNPVKPAFQKNSDTGLGLSIVRQIITKLGGELHQNEGQGTEPFFVFRIPFTRAKSSREDLNQSHRLDSLAGLQILVFENNPLNQQVVERRLRAWGCVPYIAENDLQGLKILEESQVGLIVLDLNATKKSGQELLGKIRSHARANIRTLPIIALRTLHLEGEAEDRLMEHVTDQIHKPYGADELLYKILLHCPSDKKSAESIPSIMNGQSAKKEDLPEINLEPVLEDCFGNLDTLQELVDLYKQKAMEFVGSVKLHLDRSDFKGVAFSCQKISSSLKLLRTENLLTLVDQMYKTSRTNQDLRHLKFLHLCFMEEYPETEAAINEAMVLLKKKNKK